MAVVAQGTVLKIGSTSPVAIAGVTNISFSLSADEIDATTLSSNGWKEFVSGIKGAEITLDLNFNPSASTHTQLLNAVGGSALAFTLVFPDTTDWTFSGIVTSFEVSAAADGKLEGSVTILATGAVSL